MKVLSSKGDSSEHPIDRQYQSLHCLMEPLDPDHAHFKVRETHPLSQPHSRHSSSSQMVETYLRQTHGHTHSQYSLSVLDVFAVDKEGEQERFKDIGNRWAPRGLPPSSSCAMYLPRPLQDAAVARLSSHQLGGHPQPGSPHCPSRGSRHRLHGMLA